MTLLWAGHAAGVSPAPSAKLDQVIPLRWTLVPLLALAILLLVIPGSGRVARAAPELDWRTCGAFQCATMSVPLDYADPAGRQIELSVVRQRARDSSKRIGSLFVNPGGPGGSAIDFLRAWAPTLAGSIRDSFDVITFDPRGVGESSPLICHDSLAQLIALPPDPKDDAERQTVDDETRSFAGLCGQRADGELAFLGTVSVAKDIDQLRQALGEDQISYFGYSYGTELGAVYADLFPQRVRAMVLDGAVDLSLSGDQIDFEQALAFETAYDHFLQDCRQRSCLSAPGDPDDAIQGLLRQAAQEPIPAATSDRPASESELLLGIVGSMYSQGSWSLLGRALQQALDGDASIMLRIADSYLGRHQDGSYDNSVEMNSAVNCLDHAFTTDPAAYPALADAFEAQAPHFGAPLAWGGLGCAYWAVPASPLPAPRAQGAPPIVVVGTTSDPATPYRWAVAMSQQLESGVLLTRHGEGHTAYRSGNTCIDGAVNDYLLSVEPPTAGTECGTDRFQPPPLEHPAFSLAGQPAPPAAPGQVPAATPEAVPAPPVAAPPPTGPVNAVHLAAAFAVVAALAGAALWTFRHN